MGTCCGRPNNREKKGKGTEAEYYSRYAYLSNHQKVRQAEVSGSKCQQCDALTMSDAAGNCSVCGSVKQQ